jgi:hypothetical protein
MFGAVLRLMAAGVAGRHLGDYVKNLTTKYLMLAVAGMVFSVAALFGILAGFWALNTRTQNPIWTALIMLGIFVLAGLLIVLLAYGTTRTKHVSAKQAMQDPVQALQSQIPSVEDVGHQIEKAVRRYGPMRVAGAAVAGGLIAGLLAKRFGQANVFERHGRYHPPRGYEPRVVYEPRAERGDPRYYA